MFRHRPSRLPDTITTPQRSSRPRPRPGRRRCGLGVARLEDRTLSERSYRFETATPLAFTANRGYDLGLRWHPPRTWTYSR